jgi:hypothetical protein
MLSRETTVHLDLKYIKEYQRAFGPALHTTSGALVLDIGHERAHGRFSTRDILQLQADNALCRIQVTGVQPPAAATFNALLSPADQAVWQDYWQTSITKAEIEDRYWPWLSIVVAAKVKESWMKRSGSRDASRFLYHGSGAHNLLNGERLRLAEAWRTRVGLGANFKLSGVCIEYV